jgi:hypothetical protein
MEETREKLATLTERVDNLRCDTERRHTENKDLLEKIYEQTKQTNGDVRDLKAWRALHEDLSCEREEAINEKLKEYNTRAEDAALALKILNDEHQRQIGMKKTVMFLWVPVGSVLGAVVATAAHLIEKKLGW